MGSSSYLPMDKQLKMSGSTYGIDPKKTAAPPVKKRKLTTTATVTATGKR